MVMEYDNALVRVPGPGEARVNVTWARQNGDLPDPVPLDATDGDVRQMVTEALRGGGVPGIPASPEADLSDYMVDRHDPTDARPFHLFNLRPKVPFGG